MSHHNQVAEFMRAGNQPVRTTPTIPDSQEAWGRANQLFSEITEYKEAMKRCGQAQHIHDEREARGAIIELADALGDMVYVIHGTAHTYGIDLDAVLTEIHRSNMTKVVSGRVVKDAAGKIQKPEGYEPPDLRTAIFGNPDNTYTGDEDYE